MSHDTRTTIKLMTSSATAPDDFTSFDVDDVLARVRADENVWIHVDSLHDTAAVTRILEHFGLPASLADRSTARCRWRARRAPIGTCSRNSAFSPPRRPRTPTCRSGKGLACSSEKLESTRSAKPVVSRSSARNPAVVRGPARVAAFRSGAGGDSQQKRDSPGHRLRVLSVGKNPGRRQLRALFRQFADRIQDTEDILLEGTAEPQVYQDAVRLRRELNPFGMSLLYAHEFARLLVREKPAVLSEASLIFFSENLVADARR